MVCLVHNGTLSLLLSFQERIRNSFFSLGKMIIFSNVVPLQVIGTCGKIYVAKTIKKIVEKSIFQSIKNATSFSLLLQ